MTGVEKLFIYRQRGIIWGWGGNLANLLTGQATGVHFNGALGQDVNI